MAAVPPAPAPAPQDSVLPHVSLAPPELLTLRRSPGCLRASESVRGPFKAGSQGPSVSSRHPEFPLMFTVRFCGSSSFWGWNPGLGSACVGPGPLGPSAGASAAAPSVQVLSHDAWVRDRPASRLCPSYQFLYGFFFLSSDVCVMIS